MFSEMAVEMEIADGGNLRHRMESLSASSPELGRPPYLYAKGEMSSKKETSKMYTRGGQNVRCGLISPKAGDNWR